VGEELIIHVLDDGVAELGAFDLGGAFHQAVEIVGDGLGRDGAFHALDDQIGSFVPAHIAEHHLARKDHRAGIHLVLIGILWRCTVDGLEDRAPGFVVDIATRTNANPADLGCQGV